MPSAMKREENGAWRPRCGALGVLVACATLGISTLGLLALGGCASTRSSALFSGKAAPQITSPGAVRVSPLLPVDHALIGEVRSECTLTEGRDHIDDEWLSDVDCTELRLYDALRNAAAWSGGALLVGPSCHARRRSGKRVVVGCEARVARPTSGKPSGTAPPEEGAELALRLDDPSGVQAWRMRASFEPRGIPAARAPRRADAVLEVTRAPLAAESLGTVRVACVSAPCAIEGVRAGVRVAAGRLGASHVVGVHCVDVPDEPWCVGEAALLSEVERTEP